MYCNIAVKKAYNVSTRFEICCIFAGTEIDYTMDFQDIELYKSLEQ